MSALPEKRLWGNGQMAAAAEGPSATNAAATTTTVHFAVLGRRCTRAGIWEVEATSRVRVRTFIPIDPRTIARAHLGFSILAFPAPLHRFFFFKTEWCVTLSLEMGPEVIQQSSFVSSLSLMGANGKAQGRILIYNMGLREIR